MSKIKTVLYNNLLYVNFTIIEPQEHRQKYFTFSDSLFIYLSFLKFFESTIKIHIRLTERICSLLIHSLNYLLLHLVKIRIFKIFNYFYLKNIFNILYTTSPLIYKITYGGHNLKSSSGVASGTNLNF